MNVLLSMLVVLFIGLKLTGYILWPWLWVLAPIWIPLLIQIILILIWVLYERFKTPKYKLRRFK